MLYSGGLDARTVGEIVAFNQNHSKLSHLGIWSGVGGFRNQFMSFTEQGHGYGLVQHGLIDHFLLQLYAEIAVDCTRGTWTCFESRGIPNWTPAGGYTTPSQSIVPLHVKWMLVWETPRPLAAANAPIISLCKATPRAWMASGKTIAVRNAPTTHGRVSFLVQSLLESSSSVTATVSLNSSSIVHARAERVNVTLVLRVPLNHIMRSVTVDSKPWSRFDAVAETVALEVPRNNSSVHVVVNYEQK